MGGDLTVTSKPGRGITFRLTVVAEPRGRACRQSRESAACGRAVAVAFSAPRTIPTAAS